MVCSMLSREKVQPALLITSAGGTPEFVSPMNTQNLAVGMCDFTCCQRNHIFPGIGVVPCDRVITRKILERMVRAKTKHLFDLKHNTLARLCSCLESWWLRRSGDSMTARSASYEEVLDQGYDKFMTYLHGGFDGFDITETEPLRNSAMPNATATAKNSAAYNTLDVAIDTVADPEQHDTNLMAMPGVTQRALTEKLIETCESRGDALAIIDLDSVYFPASEGSAYVSPANRNGTVADARQNMIDREIDSSYGCAYYPWVKVLDSATSREVWCPPSVAMVGVFANSEVEGGAVWFAPAGFNRAGLSDGAAGVPVLSTSQHLLSKDRDTLYENRINPIARFTGDTIVAFGQKTLQQKASALDRINVRRLAIFLKKAISTAANTVLFDQNVQGTWNRFIAAVNPILSNAQAGLGITEYRLILDETTTTPDLIDQNILYAKVLVKPARAIEFIAIDFVIASSGASFAD